jgi:hypothetical protein
MRSYRDPPDLIAGRLYWSDDVPEFARETNPTFEKLRRSLRSNWTRREVDGFFVGPEAAELERAETRLVSLPRNVRIERIERLK